MRVPSSTKSHVAVIGGGLGGMTAAGELARAGHAVTLFERSQVLGGKAEAISRDGLTLDTGPTLLTLPQVVREGFVRLGAEDLLPRFFELEHHCAYHYADQRRFDAWKDLDRSAASAEALGAGEGDALRAFFRDAEAIHRAAGEPYLEAPLDGTVDYLVRVGRRGLAGLLRGARMGTLADLGAHHFKSPELRQFVGRFATYAGASPWEASAAFALIPHLERAFGVHHVEGGMGALARALGKAVKRLGVNVQLGQAASWRADHQGFVAGPDGGEGHFDAVVVNADPLVSLGRTREPLALSGYVLLLSVDRRAPLPHHAVAFAADYRREFDELFAGRVPEDPTFYVCHPVASDPSMAPANRSGLFVMVNAAALQGSDLAAHAQAWEGISARLREQCIAAVRRVCPDLATARLDVVGERTPVDFARGGAPGGSIYGFLPHGRLGPFRRPRIRSATPGLFYSGGGTHPGGGVPMVMLSGRFAAELATRHLGAAA